MLRKNKWLVAGCVLLLLVLMAFFLYERNSRAETVELAAIDYCGYESKHPIDCWLSLLRTRFDEGGTEAAFLAFEQIYRRHPLFSDSGCHVHAHRVGDMAYYHDYLQHRDLDKVHFPKNANACGYGFYHGFFEHLIQDNPSVEFVTLTCAALGERLEEVAPAIRQTCYHGAGHGFVLAKADEALDPLQWSFSFFTDEAAEKCTALPDASEKERSECRQGVYNVINNWMEDKEYGFTYSSTTPFIYCDTEVAAEYRKDCYYEMAQKISGIAGTDVSKSMDLIQSGAYEEYYELALDIVIAGMVQSDPYEIGEQLLNGCRQLKEAYRPTCIKSIVGGQFEHGVPNAEYDIAQKFCSETSMSDEERGYCLERLVVKLYRFRTPEEVRDFCHTGVLNETVCSYAASEW